MKVALLDQVCRACSDVARVLECGSGAPMAKAYRLHRQDDFDVLVARLASAFRRHAKGAERAAIHDALDVLDIDWVNTTAPRRAALIEKALALADRSFARIPDLTVPIAEQAAQDLLSSTKQALAQQHALAVAAELGPFDRRIVQHLKRSHVLFVRDECGRRLAALSTQARAVVARGLEQGLGRKDIAQDLKSVLAVRPPFYWEIVAGAFVGRARSYGQMSGYAEAGIEQYRVEAMLDERTSDICRFLHGKVFAVRDAVASFKRASRLKDPASIKNENPWARQAGDRLFVMRDGEQIDLARVAESGDGTWGKGQFEPYIDDAALSGAGMGFPPYHGLCRTTTVPAA